MKWWLPWRKKAKKMARKDPPGLVYLGDGIEVTAYHKKERDIVVVKFTRWMPDGTKTGFKLQVTQEVIRRYQIGEGMEYPEQKPQSDGTVV